MAEYVRIGQSAPFAQTEEGEPAYPDRELVVCTTCGCVVAGTLQRAHDLSHEGAP